MFSAVVTTFIIESYKTLDAQPDDLTNQLLVHLSIQMANLPNGSILTTAPQFSSQSFVAPRSSVVINTLWSLSLILALITASLGILVKQWFHEFMAQGTQDPTYRIRIRFFRSKGLERWQVFEIAAALPLLLQIALLLFFVADCA